jgi:hypothetical protein
MVGDDALVLGDAYEVFDAAIQFSRVEYYLSEFTIAHDGGTETSLGDMHVLVNGNYDEPYSLGTWDVDEVESITFSVGVAPDLNHLDPATYSGDHPLAPQSPSMHWGWASGYRFFALEGLVGPSLTSGLVIHALGDENFFSQSHETFAVADGDTRTITLVGNYANCLVQIPFEGGMMVHSTTDEAADLLANVQASVFSAGTPDGIACAETCAPLPVMYPVPAIDLLRIEGLSLAETTLRAFDNAGRTVALTVLNGQVNVSHLPSGLYTLATEERVLGRVLIQH